MLAAVVARIHGAGRIVVSETSEERRAWAAPLADAVVEPDALADAVGGPVDLVVDAVGADADARRVGRAAPPRRLRALARHARRRGDDPGVRPRRARADDPRRLRVHQRRLRTGGRAARRAAGRVPPADADLLAGGGRGRVHGARGRHDGRVRQGLAGAGDAGAGSGAEVRAAPPRRRGRRSRRRARGPARRRHLARPDRSRRARHPGGGGGPRDRRDRADRHAGPRRPAHARLPQADLLGHRPRSRSPRARA